MKLPKIDIKSTVTKAAGHATGLALVTQVNRIPFIQKQDKPKMKGAIVAALGYLAVPMVAAAMGLKGGKKGDFANHVGEGMGIFGLAQIANAVAPNIFPKVSGVAGYEEDAVLGLGIATDEEEEEVSGYEEGAVLGTEEDF